MRREEMLTRIRERSEPWDVIVIGGGATGAGVAVDAATRGLSVLLLEREDFGKGTSSRSTKLIHGGVRYLEQGNISLVMESLKERGILRQNAPHLVHDIPFVVPNYSWWEAPFYGIGLKIYDILAGKYGFGKSQILSREETLDRIPTLQPDGLRGGVIYYDGQFDDSRLLIHLILTAVDHGAVVMNYAPVVDLHRGDDGIVDGVTAVDSETSERLELRSRVVINATGIFADEVRRMTDKTAPPMLEPSQGIHLVLDQSFLRAGAAIMVPHTSDGRVLFAIPWHRHTIVGTTDTPIEQPSYEPVPFEEEIEFVLETIGKYLSHRPKREDVLSVYTGIRPLVKTKTGDNNSTSTLSRDHTIHIDRSGLLTIVGGKWTTYRRMAEDAVDQAITLGRLPENRCVTEHLRIHGYADNLDPANDTLWAYGSDAAKVRSLTEDDPSLSRPLHSNLPYIAAEVLWAARMEMARSVEDVLARRTRALFLEAHSAVAMAPQVASLLAAELHKDDAWSAEQVNRFSRLAANYLLQKKSLS